MIAAITSKSRAIGYKGDLIYHLKDDLKYFKETTLGHAIVCGKKTYEKIFICGGDNVYKQFMDIASKLYITEIDENKTIEADSFFPKIDSSIWGVKSSSNYMISDKGHRYRFLVYERIN